jgi:hypothetical protein
MHGIDPREFWLKDVKALIELGYDPTLAYLKRFLDLVGEDAPLGELTSRHLRDFGRTLDSKFFPGIPELFDDLNGIVNSYRDIEIEFYIISGGLQDIIEGSRIVGKYFSGVYGCQLVGDEKEGVFKHLKRSINFTEKTRYLFEINKGITPVQAVEKPYLVNIDILHERRRIRFPNMIYIGDGLTDVPCFSLVMKGSDDPEGAGIAFAVFDPTKEKSAKQVLQEYLIPRRVVSAHAPDYRKDRELGALIRAAVATRCNTIQTRVTLGWNLRA